MESKFQSFRVLPFFLNLVVDTQRCIKYTVIHETIRLLLSFNKMLMKNFLFLMKFLMKYEACNIKQFAYIK